MFEAELREALAGEESLRVLRSANYILCPWKPTLLYSAAFTDPIAFYRPTRVSLPSPLCPAARPTASLHQKHLDVSPAFPGGLLKHFGFLGDGNLSRNAG